MITIKEFEYSTNALKDMEQSWYAKNWPVVYIMHNDTDAYVGETLDGIRRTKQHLDEETDTDYKLICMLTNKDFNKSVVLDMESFLIKYMSADQKYRLHNGNAGVVNHNYFNREIYQDDFREAWSKLLDLGLADKTLDAIENSDLFKYSPYKALTDEQKDALYRILNAIRNHNYNGEKNLIVINGEAGTGKTILAVYLIKLLKEITDQKLSYYPDEDGIDGMDYLNAFAKKIGNMKVGFVVPMQSLRESLKGVFAGVDGLSPNMIIKPADLAKDDFYDLLVVDEAHRLHRRKNLAQYPQFDGVNEKLGLDESGTELDWVIKRSRMQLIFYDSAQSVRPSDIDRTQFEAIVDKHKCEQIELKSQLRCKGGKDYVEYVKNVLEGMAQKRQGNFGNYDLRFFDNPDDLVVEIQKKDKEFGLCRMVAGYAWEWKSKSDKNAFDITLNGKDYRWNTTPVDWINSDNAVNEIGCIHTVQGYDLNIAGVIFGEDIYYDKNDDCIKINSSKYYDSLGKTKDADKLKEYIVHIYETLMTRGIKGTYVYVCDPALREYLKKYF
ncbi:MAG: DUF2075 domain-containing protein [Lachnospiraceae bacterium]|nr:DUF2075 domain-containing protein [Lachnospiraceae bacterium]